MFRVVESFDARYLGDTPGHLGREGGLGEDKPDVSLGAPVYCGDEKVGEVTRLAWDRFKESRGVEFVPKPYRVDSSGRMLEPLRIAVGEEFRGPLGTRAPIQAGQ